MRIWKRALQWDTFEKHRAELSKLLGEKNKFLRELENTPSQQQDKVVIKWDLVENDFTTTQFKPLLMSHKLTVKDVLAVLSCNQPRSSGVSSSRPTTRSTTA